MFFYLFQAVLDGKIREKDDSERVNNHLTQLDEKLLESEVALAAEDDMKGSDNAILIAEKTESAEALENALVAILDQLSAVDMATLDEELQKDVERKRERTNWMLDRIRALRDALATMFNSLNEWESNKNALEQQTSTLADEARTFINRYKNDAQPFSTASNDTKKAQHLLERIKQALQQLNSVNEHLQQALPMCKPARDTTDKIANELIALTKDVQVANSLCS